MGINLRKNLDSILMEAPDAGIKDISRRCGFNSVSYFGRVLREVTGYTPQGYRLEVEVR